MLHIQQKKWPFGSSIDTYPLRMTNSTVNEQLLFVNMCVGDRKSYTQLFHYYYKNLVLFAGSFIKDVSVCEDIVQTIFIKLWTNRTNLTEVTSIRSYLLKSTQNACISYIRHLKVRTDYGDYTIAHSFAECYSAEEYILHSELNEKLEKALDVLSPLHRKCFVMSRIEGKKYAEIAEELDVSVRTVELKIAESLKLLKVHLNDYFTFILLFL